MDDLRGHENADTFASEPVQFFDSETSASTPGQPARPRPPGHPRVRSTPVAGSLQVFDSERAAAPPHSSEPERS